MNKLGRYFTVNSVTLMVLLLCSVSLNLLLGSRVQFLNASLRARRAGLAAGEGFDAFTCKLASGELYHLPSDRPTILYWFSPQCAYCDRNLQNVKTLARETASSYHFLGIAAEDAAIPQYLRKHSISFPSCEVSRSMARTVKLGGTPTTVVVGPDNKVLRVFMGAYTPTLKREVEDYFKIAALPDAIEPAPVPRRKAPQ